jgi:hypothetical protein
VDGPSSELDPIAGTTRVGVEISACRNVMVRFLLRGKADMNRQARLVGSVENDPEQSLIAPGLADASAPLIRIKLPFADCDIFAAGN